jgi:hypothetical protein
MLVLRSPIGLQILDATGMRTLSHTGDVRKGVASSPDGVSEPVRTSYYTYGNFVGLHRLLMTLKHLCKMSLESKTILNEDVYLFHD